MLFVICGSPGLFRTRCTLEESVHKGTGFGNHSPVASTGSASDAGTDSPKTSGLNTAHRSRTRSTRHGKANSESCPATPHRLADQKYYEFGWGGASNARPLFPPPCIVVPSATRLHSALRLMLEESSPKSNRLRARRSAAGRIRERRISPFRVSKSSPPIQSRRKYSSQQREGT